MRRAPLRSRWVARLALAATSASIGLVATGAVLSPASADTPVKVGWWNFASGGGQAAPAPDTNAGGLRVGVSSSQTLAFGAVEYQLPKDGSGTLELKITSITSNANAPTLNAIVACPTKDDSWKAGDNQDASTAPGYDCDARQFVGRLSADQSTMTFQVDGSADINDGVLSLAIVPAHSTAIPYVGTDPGTGTDLTPPFVVDFDKPSANSFVSEDSGSSSDSSGSGSTGDGSSPPPPSSGGTTTPPVTSPPTSTDVSVPPATTDVGSGQTPVVAGQQPTGTGAGNGLTPAAAVTPAKPDNHHDLLMVLLILVLFGILYTQQASGQARAPRTVGGRTPQPDGDAAAVVPAYPVGYYGARGLGRFNKQRTGAARPLI